MGSETWGNRKRCEDVHAAAVRNYKKKMIRQTMKEQRVNQEENLVSEKPRENSVSRLYQSH